MGAEQELESLREPLPLQVGDLLPATPRPCPWTKGPSLPDPRGPADEAGLRVGDVVKAVAGTALREKTDLDKVLAATAGKEVSLAFAKGDGSGERTVKLKAVPMGALNALRYALWVEKCRKTVEEASKGELAYIHIPQMDQPSLAKFNAQLAETSRNRKVKALVLDVRNNGGGNIHGPLTNPAGAPNTLMGVFHPDLVGIQARVMQRLG
ncbi:MAG: PDZ domain-containing protein, partial [Planctomycetaceae bacterium]|nr:PDZ domain-containing protein [Planctomycetaceae bacterium]